MADGEWQGLEIIERLMNRAAHEFAEPAMVTYYATQCYDEAKHLYVFRKYLGALSARLAARGRRYATTLETPRSPSRRTTPLPRPLERMHEQPAAQLGLEPGALRRHEQAGVGNGHELLDARRVEVQRE